MSSSIVKYASQETNSTHEDNKERIDLLHGSDLTAPNLSLPAETLLQAAISLKDKVCSSLKIKFLCKHHWDGLFLCVLLLVG